MIILSETKVQQKNQRRTHCTILCSCGNVFTKRKDLLKETKCCKSCNAKAKAKQMLKHGIFSKHFRNDDLKRCFSKCSLMTYRSYSEKHPTYLGICYGLDIKRNNPEDAAKTLFEILGAPPKGKSIEKEKGGYYFCGKCHECKENNWSKTITGYVDIKQQQLTKSSTNLLKYKNELFPFHDLGSKIQIDQSSLDYLFYKKYNNIPKRERWYYVSKELTEKKNCSECRKIEYVK